MLRERDLLIDLHVMGGLAPGEILAGHRIEAVAGHGGMGVVYRATQLALDRTVALKVIAPGLLEDRTMRARFVRESKVAASIDHPNVIPIYYAGEEQGVAYIAMRYVAGDDLRRLVRRERRLPPERAASIVSQVGAALDAAHAAGLVHRDVKPANVLIDAGDHVYLTDFGLSKHALSTAGGTKPGHWVGTLDYVAPEQIRGERIDARADVYALGCLLFFTLTGAVPFPRESDEAKLWAQLSDPPPKPSEHGAPQAFDDVVERALAKAPDDRYPSAGDLGRAAIAAAAGRRPLRTERVVARGAAAPIEMETVAAQRPAVIPVSADTVAIRQTRKGVRPALLAVALLAAAGIGVVTALTLSRRENPAPAGSAVLAPTATPTPTVTRSPTPTPTPQLRATGSLRVGRRPNVARAAGGNVFVASYRRPRVTVIDAETRKKQAYAPNVGIGTADGAVGGGSVWLAVAGSHVVVRLDGRTGRVQRRIPLDGNPGVIAVSGHVLWVALTRNGDVAETLLKLDLRTGRTMSSVDYAFGIVSLTVSPKALWS